MHTSRKAARHKKRERRWFPCTCALWSPINFSYWLKLTRSQLSREPGKCDLHLLSHSIKGQGRCMWGWGKKKKKGLYLRYLPSVKIIKSYKNHTTCLLADLKVSWICNLVSGYIFKNVLLHCFRYLLFQFICLLISVIPIMNILDYLILYYS